MFLFTCLRQSFATWLLYIYTTKGFSASGHLLLVSVSLPYLTWSLSRLTRPPITNHELFEVRLDPQCQKENHHDGWSAIIYKSNAS